MEYWDATSLLALVIPILAIAGFFLVIALRISSEARVRELEIRQRIAMIERGMVPPPEVDPGRFEESWHRPGLFHRRSRHRSAGVTLIGVGFGLMLLIGVAGESPSQGVGVGGFLVIVGIAFFLNSLFDRSHDEWSRPGHGPSATEPPATSNSGLPPR